MDWLDSITGFVDKYGGAIEKGTNLLRDGYNAFNQNRAEQGSRNDILDAYRAQLAARAQRQQDLYNYQLQQMQANEAASAANSRAAAAASMANQKAALKAGKKGLKTQRKYLEQIAGNYQPFLDAAKDLVPKSAENYRGFLDTTSLLNAYLAPRAMEVLGNAPKAAMEFAPKASAVNVAVPQGQAVTFPNLNELMRQRG